MGKTKYSSRLSGVLAICMLMLSACSSREILPASVDIGRDFYPVKTGNTWIYLVDSIRYVSRYDAGSLRVVTDTLSGKYYVKEVIADSIGLQEGNPLYRVELYHASDIEGPWIIDSVWSIQRGEDKILKTVNNRPIVKLKYPLQEGSRWDGNQYNIFQDSSETAWFTAKEVGKESYFQNNPFASVLIIQQSDSSCTEKTRIWERYLKGIGPTFLKRLSHIYYLAPEDKDPCGKLPVIESGIERTFTLQKFENKN